MTWMLAAVPAAHASRIGTDANRCSQYVPGGNTAAALETDSTWYGVCGAMAWAGYDADGNMIVFNKRSIEACIAPKNPGHARNEQHDRIESVNPRVVSIRTWALWGEGFDRSDEIDWQQLEQVFDTAATAIGLVAG